MLDSIVLLRNLLSWEEEHVVETLKCLAKQQKEDNVEDKDAIVLRKDLVRYFEIQFSTKNIF